MAAPGPKPSECRRRNHQGALRGRGVQAPAEGEPR
eukprot:CAMPEP_0175616954 /NCGR_PEP_ID=MMETSP0096-20121207/66151_1 /TAXON_ID=311494 /ORGANISM="Alexandrium monilatum, Strain CCMP3105" /LENGTH=34 /DNA_ID= /DNA_START= /DNA_END= /DNA_ORIENTATION=